MTRALQRRLGISLVAMLLAAGIGIDTAKAQEEVGGPYTPDENTVLLLHFDDNLENASDATEDGVGHGSLSYLPSFDTELGQVLRIDNDSRTDSSYVTIADNAALDLTESWTIEGWVNIFTFGETSDDWRWVPRLIIKTGDEVFWKPNYWIEIWGSERFFSSGYHAPVGDGLWPQSNTPSETMVPGQWYHVTFIRDAEEEIIAQLVHNQARELIAFSSYKYDPIAEAPPVNTDQPVHIGWAGLDSGDSWLDGFVDEIRISNVVRDFSVPPILADATELENQASDVAGYEVSVDAFKIGGGNIADVTLHYCVTGTCEAETDFQTVAMTLGGDRTYTASIPQQPVGSTVSYYISATDDSELEATYPSNVIESGGFLSFGVFTPTSQTLSLDFEEGQGAPEDSSPYGHEITVNGDVAYSTNAVEGEYSLEFNSADSTYLSVDAPAPFLVSNEMTVEFWFNADSIKNEVRLIGKQHGTGAWWEQNFEIKFKAGHGIAAGSYHPGAGNSGFVVDQLIIEDSLLVGTWYHAVYVLSADSALFQVTDADGNLIGRESVGITGDPVAATGEFRLGHSGPAAQGYYDGLIDGVKIYNYALEEYLETDTEGAGELPLQVVLEQNYPNPFNPATSITYHLPAASNVKLSVFDVLGREVRTLVDTHQAAGEYRVSFDASALSSGVYFYRLETPNAARVRSMLLLK